MKINFLEVYLMYELLYAEKYGINEQKVDNNYILTNMGLILKRDIDIDKFRQKIENILSEALNVKKFMSDEKLREYLYITKKAKNLEDNLKEELKTYFKDLEDMKRKRENGKQVLKESIKKEQKSLF